MNSSGIHIEGVYDQDHSFMIVRVVAWENLSQSKGVSGDIQQRYVKLTKREARQVAYELLRHAEDIE